MDVCEGFFVKAPHGYYLDAGRFSWTRHPRDATSFPYPRDARRELYKILAVEAPPLHTLTGYRIIGFTPDILEEEFDSVEATRLDQ